MAQRKEKLLSQKHTGFEELFSHSNIDSLSFLADFFFADLIATNDSDRFLLLIPRVDYSSTFFM